MPSKEEESAKVKTEQNRQVTNTTQNANKFKVKKDDEKHGK